MQTGIDFYTVSNLPNKGARHASQVISVINI